MNPLDDVQDAIAALDQLTPQLLREALVSAYCELAFARGGRDTGAALLNETRNLADQFGRRMTLISAIADTSENALSVAKLDAIAAIVWPAPQPYSVDLERASHDGPVYDTSQPTRMSDLSVVAMEAMFLTASGLLWNAHWFLKSIQNVVGFQAGPDLARQIEGWRDKVNVWRHATGVEKHETEEVKRNPH